MSGKLFDALTIGELTLKNRVVLAPLTRGRAGSERLANEMMAEYYSQRSNAGLLISEATTISPQGNGWVNSPGIYSDEMAEAWKTVTNAVHAQGTPMFLQLWHTGRASHSDFHNGAPTVAPSAIGIQGDHQHTPLGKKPYEVPRALEIAEVRQTVADYRKAAQRAQQAGFDGVEVHGANGYLIDTFLQSKTNHRTDEYGGSVEKRYRFLKEVVENVLEVWGPNRVGVRLSPNGVFNDMGSPDFREQFLYVAEQLNQYPLAYLHVMDGLAFGFHGLGEPLTLPEVRQVFAHPLMGNCGYTQEAAEEVLSAGAADLVAFGRPFITNPDLVDRFRHGWPLTDSNDMSTWYSPGPVGYVDYPTYTQST